MVETWKSVVGYEGRYEVSDTGLVRSVARSVANTATSSRMLAAVILAPFVHRGGYMVVKLSRSRQKTSHYVHRLVAEAFLGSGEARQEVLHADGDKKNNRLENLSWGSRRDNMRDRHRLGEVAKGERHGMAKLTEDAVRAILSDTRYHHLVAADYGVSRSMISMIKRGKHWRHLAG
jgi:hypothetical protein